MDDFELKLPGEETPEDTLVSATESDNSTLALELDTLTAENTSLPVVQPVDEKTAALKAIAGTSRPDASTLSPAQRKQVTEFAKKIDITSSTQIMQFGSTSQKKMAGFSEQALANVKTKDVDQIGEMITSLVVELQGFSIDQDKKPGLFKKTRNKIVENKARYDTAAANVDKISGMLENHKVTLLKDVAMLDQMYEKNLSYYKELTMYILAGREKLDQVILEELPKLEAKARESGLPEDAQAVNHLSDMCNRFDKKLHDLDLTRTISMQMTPQIRLIQSTDAVMVEKIQSSISNTIPLWKNQMVLALGMAHSQSAIKAQREVTDITNQLLKKNADALKLNTIEAAKESERAIVDIETLRHTNRSLIETLDEVMKVQTEGRQKRREAEKELRGIEEELKTKLLQGRSVAVASSSSDSDSGTDDKVVVIQ
ncbi:MAG: toxic anion resistance protein [Oscillospiraceae bacterium]|jgi:uncharacterized protein YaaN involved in tellurite resistance|nr:toxic anion resistance protein [Oscillospiraceae bacterium]